MNAIYRQNPKSWGSRRAAPCELAELVADEAVNASLDNINTYNPGFIGEGASWYVGRYHCSSEPAPGPPNAERPEVETCTHTGRYANSVHFWTLKTGEER
jgi:hypothetical protein